MCASVSNLQSSSKIFAYITIHNWLLSVETEEKLGHN